VCSSLIDKGKTGQPGDAKLEGPMIRIASCRNKNEIFDLFLKQGDRFFILIKGGSDEENTRG